MIVLEFGICFIQANMTLYIIRQCSFLFTKGNEYAYVFITGSSTYSLHFENDDMGIIYRTTLLRRI